MSPCARLPRLGTEPRPLEDDSVSLVRFSSSTLSLPVTGIGSGVGVFVLSGRKMRLKPLPLNAPVKAASGPRLGSAAPRVLSALKLDTSPKLKPLDCERAVSKCISLMVPPSIGPGDSPVSHSESGAGRRQRLSPTGNAWIKCPSFVGKKLER